jgi:hypothetical protein
MNTIELGVYRVRGWELDTKQDDEKIALEFHDLRKDSLHEILDSQNEIEIKNWGDTDDQQPHEFVTIVVGIVAPAVANHVVIPVLKKVFEKIADKAVDTVFEKAVSWIVSKFKKKQDEKKIGEFQVTLPGGAIITITNAKQGDKISFLDNGQKVEYEF